MLFYHPSIFPCALPLSHASSFNFSIISHFICSLSLPSTHSSSFIYFPHWFAAALPCLSPAQSHSSSTVAPLPLLCLLHLCARLFVSLWNKSCEQRQGLRRIYCSFMHHKEKKKSRSISSTSEISSPRYFWYVWKRMPVKPSNKSMLYSLLEKHMLNLQIIWNMIVKFCGCSVELKYEQLLNGPEINKHNK